jgi:hypothetical protein
MTMCGYTTTSRNGSTGSSLTAALELDTGFTFFSITVPAGQAGFLQGYVCSVIARRLFFK